MMVLMDKVLFGGLMRLRGGVLLSGKLLGSHSYPGVFGMKDAQICIGIQVGDLMRDGYNVYGWGYLGVFRMLLVSILRRVAVDAF